VEEALSALPVVPRAVARRLLLDAQGLLDDPARRCTPARLYRTVERMGFVQIDSINVVARAQHLTLGSRFDHYRPPALAHLLEESRVLFEHWTHDAAAIPTRWFPHWHHRFAIQRRDQLTAVMDRRDDLLPRAIASGVEPVFIGKVFELLARHLEQLARRRGPADDARRRRGERRGFGAARAGQQLHFGIGGVTGHAA